MKILEESRQSLLAKEFLCRQREIKIWMEELLSYKLPTTNRDSTMECSTVADAPADLCSSLRDGVVLCNVLNALVPGEEIIPKAKILTKYSGSVLEFKQTDNIIAFLNACKERLGLAENYLFEVNDLWERKNIINVVQCLHTLAYSVSQLSMKLKAKLDEGEEHGDEEVCDVEALGDHCSMVTTEYKGPLIRRISIQELECTEEELLAAQIEIQKVEAKYAQYCKGKIVEEQLTFFAAPIKNIFVKPYIPTAPKTVTVKDDNAPIPLEREPSQQKPQQEQPPQQPQQQTEEVIPHDDIKSEAFPSKETVAVAQTETDDKSSDIMQNLKQMSFSDLLKKQVFGVNMDIVLFAVIACLTVVVFGVYLMLPKGTYPANCEAKGAGLYRARPGEVAKFTIYAKDYFNADIKDGGDKFRATLREKEKRHSVEAIVLDNNDGTYYATYQVHQSGNYMISITLDDVHIKGSPFTAVISHPTKEQSNLVMWLLLLALTAAAGGGVYYFMFASDNRAGKKAKKQ